MADVTEKQFDILSDIKVFHRPTKATYSTYRYEDPDQIVDFTVRRGADSVEYPPADVDAVAVRLFRKLALARSTPIANDSI